MGNVLDLGSILWARMIATVIDTKWKFIVEYEDEQTGAIAGILGEAAYREKCEMLVEEETPAGL